MLTYVGIGEFERLAAKINPGGLDIKALASKSDCEDGFWFLCRSFRGNLKGLGVFRGQEIGENRL
jgi:hypothetical protein